MVFGCCVEDAVAEQVSQSVDGIEMSMGASKEEAEIGEHVIFGLFFVL